MGNPKVKACTLAQCGLFTALVAVGAFIQIPVPFMDYFTLQFLFVILAGMLLGPQKGAAAVGAYVLIGLIGIPIFAAGGGPGYIFRPSFGYLLGFVAAAAVCGLAAQTNHPTFGHMLLAALSGFVATYAIGLVYKYLILNFYLQTPTPWTLVLLSCFPLDIPGDLLLCLAGAYLGKRLRPMLNRLPSNAGRVIS